MPDIGLCIVAVLKIFISDAKFIDILECEGSIDKGEFLLPHDIAIDSSDNMYI